jgi:uncharacterized protein YqjF (DUF2071 family)
MDGTQPLPAGPWVMRQTWHDLLFAHWQVPPALLRPLIPESLAIDTFNGAAWVGVVPFRMTAVRLRGTPYTPFADAFPELNVRTYVVPRSVDGEPTGKPGVWFFSLDAGSHLAVEAARRWFLLPYFSARMTATEEGKGVRYTSHRTHRGAASADLSVAYRPIAPVTVSASGTLTSWLTERYCLYTTDRRGNLYRGDIHHARWPLQAAEADIATNTMAAAHGITLPDTPPLLHFARRLDVRCWRIRRQGAEGRGQKAEGRAKTRSRISRM